MRVRLAFISVSGLDCNGSRSLSVKLKEAHEKSPGSIRGAPCAIEDLQTRIRSIFIPVLQGNFTAKEVIKTRSDPVLGVQSPQMKRLLPRSHRGYLVEELLGHL